MNTKPIELSSAQLIELAEKNMIEKGLQPHFDSHALQQLRGIETNYPSFFKESTAFEKLDHLAWFSIDDDDSRDIDQLTHSQTIENGQYQGHVCVRVAIADVDALVPPNSPIDLHAKQNTTTVYTAAKVFPMLPSQLCTHLSSLNEFEVRMAIVTEMVFNLSGILQTSRIYRALVRSQAKLAYDSVADWLDKKGKIPQKILDHKDIMNQIIQQEALAQQLHLRRAENGALEFESKQAKAITDKNGSITALKLQENNCARTLIAELMVAANGVVANFLFQAQRPFICRIVRSPQRWQEIQKEAARHGYTLPDEASSQSLRDFLNDSKRKDPENFPDLSQTIVKLMGAGEYALQPANGNVVGHFGLAVEQYLHSTAPNRRYADIVTQRLVKATLRQTPSPYSEEALEALAKHCNEQGSDANKVQRQLSKSEAALVLQNKIGEIFPCVITGVNTHGVFLRTLTTPALGRVTQGEAGLRVGQRINARLLSVDVLHGYIDFAKT